MNNIDPSGHFSVGLQSGFGLFSAAVNAVAILSGDSNLSIAMSCFNMFIAIKTSIQIAQIKKAITEAAQTDQPAPDPVETAENASTPNAPESGGQGEETGDNTAGTASTTENVAPETKPAEAKKLTIEELKADIAAGKIDLSQSIDTLMKQYNVPPEQALEVIKAAVSYIVSNLAPAEGTGYVEMPFNVDAPDTSLWGSSVKHFRLLGLEYGNYPVTGDGVTWARPESLIKAMTSALYFNYLNPNFHIDFNDLSLATGAKLPDHQTHMLGTSFDVKIIWNDKGTYRQITNIQQSTKNKNNLYIKGNKAYQNNKKIVQNYVNILNSLGARQVLWCDWTVKGVDQRVKTKIQTRVVHRHHLHFEI
ncbi:MAG: hypothetical protein K6U80_18820 [Firmicutes bacterium]|nr:hypothetical protein [Bacillota bacterium]